MLHCKKTLRYLPINDITLQIKNIKYEIIHETERFYYAQNIEPCNYGDYVIGVGLITRDGFNSYHTEPHIKHFILINKRNLQVYNPKYVGPFYYRGKLRKADKVFARVIK